MDDTISVELFGGPLHGKTVTIPKHFRRLDIAKPNKTIRELKEYPDEELTISSGSYSMVGQSTKFEWDGWFK